MFWSKASEAFLLFIQISPVRSVAELIYPSKTAVRGIIKRFQSRRENFLTTIF